MQRPPAADTVAAVMAHATRGSSVGLLVRVPTIVFLVLVAIRLAILGHTIAEVTGKPVTDVYVLRIEQIASSPGTPYRDFPVEYMFPENLAMQLIGGSGAEATAIRLVFIAFAADLAAAAADGRLRSIWCWGCRCCPSCISASTSCRSRSQRGGWRSSNVGRTTWAAGSPSGRRRC